MNAACSPPPRLDAVESPSDFQNQRQIVWQAVADGGWHYLADLAARLNLPEQSVSARLRDFRKARYGSHVVERKKQERGLYAYRVVNINVARESGDPTT